MTTFAEEDSRVLCTWVRNPNKLKNHILEACYPKIRELEGKKFIPVILTIKIFKIIRFNFEDKNLVISIFLNFFLAENQQLREQLATTNQQAAIAMEEEEVPTAPALHDQYILQELEGSTYIAFSMRALIHQ